MSIGLILLIVLIVMLLGGLPTWGYSRTGATARLAVWGWCWWSCWGAI